MEKEGERRFFGAPHEVVRGSTGKNNCLVPRFTTYYFDDDIKKQGVVLREGDATGCCVAARAAVGARTCAPSRMNELARLGAWSPLGRLIPPYAHRYDKAL